MQKAAYPKIVYLSEVQIGIFKTALIMHSNEDSTLI